MGQLSSSLSSGVFKRAAFVPPFVKAGCLVPRSRTGSSSHLLPGSTFHPFSLWASCQPASQRSATHLLERLSVWPPGVTSARHRADVFRRLCVSEQCEESQRGSNAGQARILAPQPNDNQEIGT